MVAVWNLSACRRVDTRWISCVFTDSWNAGQLKPYARRPEPTLMRLAEAVLGLCAVMVLGFGLLLILFDEGVPFTARDLNCDGWISPVELVSGGLDYGWRPATDGVLGCMEAYSLKDGLPAVCVCQEVPHCRIARKDSYRSTCAPN
jgi:hypothetical protein